MSNTEACNSTHRRTFLSPSNSKITFQTQTLHGEVSTKSNIFCTRGSSETRLGEPQCFCRIRGDISQIILPHVIEHFQHREVHKHAWTRCCFHWISRNCILKNRRGLQTSKRRHDGHLLHEMKYFRHSEVFAKHIGEPWYFHQIWRKKWTPQETFQRCYVSTQSGHFRTQRGEYSRNEKLLKQTSIFVEKLINYIFWFNVFLKNLCVLRLIISIK